MNAPDAPAADSAVPPTSRYPAAVRGVVDAPRYGRRHWAFALLLAAAYCAFVIPQWSEAYIDFGDGNYMYIASRIADGAVVYRDILAPQPPCHLFLGAALVNISRALDQPNPILTFRVFSLLLHLASFVLVIRLGGRAWGSAAAGVAAGMVYMLLPLGLWWSMAYQSEPLEIFFLLLMMNAALGGTMRGDLAAGVFGALAALTNATAVPFLTVLIVYMLIANPRRALRIAAPALVLAAVVTGGLEWYSEGRFLNNVVLNQVGTYPPEGFVRYALGKLSREGGDILRLEGIYMVVAGIGLFRFLNRSPLDGEARGGLAWFCLATMASFVYVTKGGTVDYIYCLAAPALAVMGAGVWIEVLEPRADRGAAALERLLASFIPRAAGLGFLVLLLAPSAGFFYTLWTQQAYELPDIDHAPPLADGTPGPNVQQVSAWIERHSRPGDTILAPPFYAVVTGRRIWGDYSEIFIWTIKDHNDRQSGNLAGEGHTKILQMADAIRKAELPIVILELAQTGRIPEIIEALSESYRPLIVEPYPTLNTQLGIFIPKGPEAPAV